MVFSFLSCRKQNDAATHLRRLIDLTMPNPPVSCECRSGRRYNRSVPVMIGRFDRKGKNEEDFQFAVTKDIVDFGVGVVTTNEIPPGDVTFAYWPPDEAAADPYYFRGRVVSCEPIGGPFWQVGVEVSEFLNTEYPQIVERLRPLAAQLATHHEANLTAATV